MAEIERVMIEDEIVSVVIKGEFDSADEARAELAVDFVLGLEIPAMLMDLSECEFIDSTGLRTLIRSHERARRAGTPVAIVGSGPQVRRVFELTGVGKRLAIFDERDEALESLRSGPPPRQIPPAE